MSEKEEIAIYLGTKGYTIYKKNITIEEQELLRKELTVSPYIPKNSLQQPTYFQIYRESPNKIYIPKFYGYKVYGDVEENRLPRGKKINLKFNGDLRDFQKPIVKTFVEAAKKKGGGLLEIHTGAGKCLAKGTKIIMADGEIKKVEDILVGDKIMGDDSKPRTILSLARGTEVMYDVIANDKTKYTVNKSHILSLRVIEDCSFENKGLFNNYKKYDIVDINIKDFLKLPENIKNKLKGYRVPIYFKKKEVKIDPYSYGYLFSIKNNKKNILELESKISILFKCNDVPSRLNLLAGIIDVWGCSDKYNYIIEIKNKVFSQEIEFICRSLGFIVNTRFIKDNINDIFDFYEITIKSSVLCSTNSIPVRIVKKVYSKNNIDLIDLNNSIKVVKKEVGEYFGFEIDGNRRFLLGDCTVTHNTVMGLNIISKLKKKTIIIVHKEFLLRQWIERIEQFLPDAKVGRIQGENIDVEGKDIVIGMLQSLSMKDYPSNIFEDFGLSIFDEVHHVSAEVFSRVLFKVVTKYTLGLSATMKRKDGLTKVIKMFLGDVVYKKERENSDYLVVKNIQYQVNDDDFNEIELNWRGQVHYTKMIKKICDYNRRSEFILQVLKKIIDNDEKNKAQIMILAHNKSLLKYLHDAIEHRKMSSVGYYVGGMKEKDLKKSETKKVVIATYAMAEEGLDIKSLTTLIMATPRVDVTQAVGRILRKKHDNAEVYDIVDQHAIFQRHWKKRMTFYRKQKFRIFNITSEAFIKNKSWDCIFDKSKNIKSNIKTKKSTKNKAPKDKLTIKIETDPLFQGKCLI